jgi:hypothetical protein
MKNPFSFITNEARTFNQENLVWSFEAVRNSCDKELQSIIDAKMLKYKASERFGPL